MRTLIVIPAYNEAENVPELIKNIQKLNYEYLVINDCSQDGSAELYERLKINHLDLSINLGLAAVTQVGFKYAIDYDYDSVIVIDGDGQHPPKYIQTLLDKLNEGYDYVVGSRFKDIGKPWSLRMLGSRILSSIIYLKTGRLMTDPTSGMRAIGKNVVREFSRNLNFIAEPDALTYILRRKYKVVEVQVSMDDRENGVSYFANPLRSIKFMFNSIISILFLQ